MIDITRTMCELLGWELLGWELLCRPLACNMPLHLFIACAAKSNGAMWWGIPRAVPSAVFVTEFAYVIRCSIRMLLASEIVIS